MRIDNTPARAGSVAVLRVTSGFIAGAPVGYGGVPPTPTALCLSAALHLRLLRKIAWCIALLLLSTPLAFADDNMDPIVDGVFKVENDSGMVTQHINIPKPFPGATAYVIQGSIRYDLNEIAYLEVSGIPLQKCRLQINSGNDFTMMKRISGNSNGNWQTFRIPFSLGSIEPESVFPSLLVMIHGKGTVEIMGLDVFTDSEIEWFNKRTAGMLGGILGTAGGLWGALVGCLAGILIPRGKGRRCILGLLWFGLTAGIAFLVVGLAAVCLGQPYHVWYLFVHPGVILTILAAFFLKLFPRVYAEVELRRMQALDM